jgi:hypothetical protein
VPRVAAREMGEPMNGRQQSLYRYYYYYGTGLARRGWAVKGCRRAAFT